MCSSRIGLIYEYTRVPVSHERQKQFTTNQNVIPMLIRNRLYKNNLIVITSRTHCYTRVNFFCQNTMLVILLEKIIPLLPH